MVYISDTLIDEIIKEDMPYLDITTDMLNIGKEKGRIEFFSRLSGCVSGVSVASRLLKRLGADITFQLNDGDMVEEGSLILSAESTAEILHAGWKTSLNLLEYLSGISTFAKNITEKARKVNENISVTATRKSMPKTRELVTMAFSAGGMVPHRMGLSETILIFKQHLEFTGGLDGLEKYIKQSKYKAHEKKIILETENYEDSIKALSYDFIDGLQLDKLKVENVAEIVNKKNIISPNLIIISAGGINMQNVEEYAKTGVDVIATSSIFHALPLDIKVKITKI